MDETDYNLGVFAVERAIAYRRPAPVPSLGRSRPFFHTWRRLVRRARAVHGVVRRGGRGLGRLPLALLALRRFRRLLPPLHLLHLELEQSQSIVTARSEASVTFATRKLNYCGNGIDKDLTLRHFNAFRLD